MAPANALSYTYTEAADIIALLSTVGEESRLDDSGDGSVSAAELAYLSRIATWATARVNLFVLGKHAASALAESHIANAWTTTIAAYFLCCRRGNPPSGAIKEMYHEVMEDLKAVQKGEITLPDIELRSAAWPAWSNITLADHFRNRKLRVQRQISEKRGGRPDYDQAISHPDIHER